MKKSHLKITFILIVLSILTILNILELKITNIYLLSTFIIFIIILLKILLGYEKDNSRYNKDAYINIFIITMILYIISYITGFFIGFIEYNYTFKDIIYNIIPIIIFIILTEVFRYMLNKKISNNKYLLFFSCISFILFNIMLDLVQYNLNSYEDLLAVSSLLILPAISTNILLTYTSIKLGYKVNIFYRLLVELPYYIIPIYPNFNEYLGAIYNFISPLIIYYFIYKLIKRKEKKEETRAKYIIHNIFGIVLAFIMILTIILTSGAFKYYALTIGSGSMEPTLYIGDIAIVKKINDLNNLKIDDILVYIKDDLVVVHRITNITNINEKIIVKTKGDNNEEEDNWIVSEDEILGTAVNKIKYIGYLTIILNQTVN